QDLRSRGGYCLFYRGSLIATQSKLFKLHAQSSSEAEMMAINELAKVIVFVQEFLKSIEIEVEQPSILKTDNKTSIVFGKTTKLFDRTKHIGIKYRAIKDYIQEGRIRIEYINTDDMIADIMTKPLSRVKFEKHQAELLISNNHCSEEECVKEIK